MKCLTSIVFCYSHRTDEPKVPELLFHMIASWMQEYDIKSLDFSLDEVSDYEE